MKQNRCFCTIYVLRKNVIFFVVCPIAFSLGSFPFSLLEHHVKVQLCGYEPHKLSVSKEKKDHVMDKFLGGKKNSDWGS